MVLLPVAACRDANAPIIGAVQEGAPRMSLNHLRWESMAARQFTSYGMTVGEKPTVAAAAAMSSSRPVLYLAGDGIPSGSMAASAPTAATLPNYDAGRSAFPGLLLAKSDDLVGETDPTKYQQWLGLAGPSIYGDRLT